jgi:hypothetical protein
MAARLPDLMDIVDVHVHDNLDGDLLILPADSDDDESDSDRDDADEKKQPPVYCQRCSSGEQKVAAVVVCRNCRGSFLCSTCDSACHVQSWASHSREALVRTDPLAVTESMLSSLVGLDTIKERVRELAICHLELSKTAALRGLHYSPPKPVWVLCGNPGVGKTTIAAVLARVFVAVGLAAGPIVKLKKDQIPSNSPGTYLDKMAKRVRNGVLMVDEVQSFLRSTTVIQFLMANMDKSYEHRPCVLLMGYPAPRKPNVDDFLKKDSGLRRRVEIMTVPNFDQAMVTQVLQEKIARSGYTLGISSRRLRRYVSRIPTRFFPIHNGSLAEKIFSASMSLQALATYSESLTSLQERLTLARATVKAAFERAVFDLERDESATISG